MEIRSMNFEAQEVALGNYVILDWVKNDPLRPYAEVPRDIAANVTPTVLQNSKSENPTITAPRLTPGSQKRAYYALVCIEEYNGLGEIATRTFVIPPVVDPTTTIVSKYEKGKLVTPKEK